LQCGCALRTSYAIVPATFSICTSHVDNMLHGFNLIVLQQFFSSEELGSLVGSTLTQIEIEADLLLSKLMRLCILGHHGSIEIDFIIISAINNSI